MLFFNSYVSLPEDISSTQRCIHTHTYIDIYIITPMTLLLCGRRGPWCRANPLRSPGKYKYIYIYVRVCVSVCARAYIYVYIYIYTLYTVYLFHKILCTRDVANPICILNRTGPWRRLWLPRWQLQPLQRHGGGKRIRTPLAVRCYKQAPILELSLINQVNYV